MTSSSSSSSSSSSVSVSVSVSTSSTSVAGDEDCYGEMDKEGFNNCILKWTNHKRKQHLADPMVVDRGLATAA